MTETVSEEVYKRLEHIKEGCEKIIGYVAGGRDQFDSDEQVQIAIMHYISVIGEASKLHNIPKDFQVVIQKYHGGNGSNRGTYSFITTIRLTSILFGGQ